MYLCLMEKRECLECREPVKGRVDKKFCSDYCRNAYNNNVNKDSKKPDSEYQQSATKKS